MSIEPVNSAGASNSIQPPSQYDQSNNAYLKICQELHENVRELDKNPTNMEQKNKCLDLTKQMQAFFNSEKGQSLHNETQQRVMAQGHAPPMSHAEYMQCFAQLMSHMQAFLTTQHTGAAANTSDSANNLQGFMNQSRDSPNSSTT